MSKLHEERFEAFNADAPQVPADEQQTLLRDIPQWQVVTLDGEQQLQRTFKLKNFVEAQAFTNKVGDLAESEDHHPAILLEYGKVTVRWWTHAIGGLHRNDFVMAARTDQLAA